MPEKKIAIFIPCYNAARTIEATLHSVEESVRQFGSPIPVYIYDDGSKDNSLEIARKIWKNTSVLYIEQNSVNMGERRTTNRAFESFYHKYDWVLIIHADDIVKPEWLSEMYRQIQLVDDGKCFTVWSSFDSLDDDTGVSVPGDNTGAVSMKERTPAEKKQYIVKLYCSWHISGAAINLRLFQQLKGFDVSMAQFGDTDFFARGLLADFTDVYLSRTLTFYRVIVNSVSSVSVKTNRDIREIEYIIDKFRGILDARERGRLRKNLRVLSLRRAGRWLIRLDVSNFFFCINVVSRTFTDNKNSIPQ
jgi:glycosyltransferase involved in cell wall biosynthesis